MAVGSVNALVDEVLAYTSDYEAETLREEAVNLAFDMKLGADELGELLSAIELRTGTSLERRTGTRPSLIPKPQAKRH
ncbi:MAG: hypothetical protein H7Y60_15285 [Rhodospirillaceae bacterium]|nr:hypothetical protein [Rhodospirillales bacterium]